MSFFDDDGIATKNASANYWSRNKSLNKIRIRLIDWMRGLSCKNGQNKFFVGRGWVLQLRLPNIFKEFLIPPSFRDVLAMLYIKFEEEICLKMLFLHFYNFNESLRVVSSTIQLKYCTSLPSFNRQDKPLTPLSQNINYNLK